MHDELSKQEWLAFRYLTDELSNEEAQNFEASLAQDPAACETLARMVGLVELIRSAKPAESPSRASLVALDTPSHAAPKVARWAFASLGLAAAIAVGITIYLQGAGENREPASSFVVSDGLGESELGRLAIAWDSVRSSVSDATSIGEPVAMLAMANRDDADSNDNDNNAASTEIISFEELPRDEVASDATPTWMLAAFEELQDEPNGDSDADGESTLEM